MRTRVQHLRLALAALLAVACGWATSGSASALPSPREADGATTPVRTVVVTDSPDHHFGFSTMLSQSTATTPGTTASTIPPASSGSGACVSVVGSSCTASGTVYGTWTKTGSGTFTVNAIVPSTAAVSTYPVLFVPTTYAVETFTCPLVSAVAVTLSCSGTTSGDALQGAIITWRFINDDGSQVDLTGSLAGSGTTSLTLAQALASVTTSGVSGVPCSTAYGVACSASGSVTGTGSSSGTTSQAWSVTATLPSGLTVGNSTIPVGTTPYAVFSTTTGLQGFACSALTSGATSATCSGTVASPALLSSTASVVFATGTTTTGTVSGPGTGYGTTWTTAPAVGAPLVGGPVPGFGGPPVGAGFGQPAPFGQAPPLGQGMPPTGPPPSLASMPVANAPAVPVIPEAETAGLLLLGLGALVLRALRRGAGSPE